MGSCSGRCTLLALCALQLVSPGVLSGSPDPHQSREAPGITAWTNLLRPVFLAARHARGAATMPDTGCALLCLLGEWHPGWRGQVLGSIWGPPAPRNKSLRVGLPQDLCSGPECLVRGTILHLVPTGSEGACGSEKQVCESYRRSTRGRAGNKVQCLSVDIRVVCSKECDRLARPACAQALSTLASQSPWPVEGRGFQARTPRVEPPSPS